MVRQAMSLRQSNNVCLSYNFPEKNNGRLNMKTIHNVHNIIVGSGKLRRTLTQPQPAGVIERVQRPLASRN